MAVVIDKRKRLLIIGLLARKKAPLQRNRPAQSSSAYAVYSVPAPAIFREQRTSARLAIAGYLHAIMFLSRSQRMQVTNHPGGEAYILDHEDHG